jgi:hypothetical protein
LGNLTVVREAEKLIAECRQCYQPTSVGPGYGTRWRHYLPTRQHASGRDGGALLTVCCATPILDRSTLTYECPVHAFRHILPLSALDEATRKQVLDPQALARMERASNGFGRALLLVLVGVFALLVLGTLWKK